MAVWLVIVGLVRYNTAMKASLPPKVCEVCGMTWQPRTREQAARNRTCSRECAKTLISKARTGQRYAPTRTAVCPQCGETFIVRAYRSNRPAKYCSPSCRARANAAHLVPYAGNMKGRKRTDPRYGPHNPAWKGGITYFKSHGQYTGVKYIRAPAWALPMARADGYAMEHRLIMARIAGRLLDRTEVVHHRDHNPANNAPDNLELWPSNGSHKAAEHGRFVSGAACRFSPRVLAPP